MSSFPAENTEFLKKIKKDYGQNHFIGMGNKKYFYAFSPKAVEDVCVTKYNDFIKTGGVDTLSLILGRGLLTSEEPKHLFVKKQVSNHFSHKNIKKYTENIISTVNDVLKKWENKKTVFIENDIMFIMYKTIFKNFFSTDSDEYFDLVKNSMLDLTKEAPSFNDNFYNAKKNIRMVSQKIIKDRINSNNQYDDFLNTLIINYNNGNLSFDDLDDEVVTIILSSFETTAHVISWSVYYLTQNKKWQKIFSDEYTNIFDKLNNDDFYQTLFKNEHSNYFINEVLRLCPPVWSTKRLSIRDTEIDGVPIKSGTTVLLSSFINHRNEQIFKNPESFIPERWKENLESMLSPGDFFPFHLGQRSCIGKYFAIIEIKIFLLAMCNKFSISLVGPLPQASEIITYKIKDDVQISLENNNII